MKRITALIFTLVLLAGISARAEKNSYGVVKLEGTVNPIMSEFIVESIKEANDEKLQFLVIQLDTPGGLMDSMRDIIKAILTSEIPVVVYTFPKGAQAASAGGFIMLSAHVAAMSPGTEIGAMHPVSPALDFMKKDEKGDPDGVMEKKVLNDTIAYARSLAQKRHRNIKWTEKAVKQAISSTYSEALKLGVIDLVAEDMNDLLKKLNGYRVNVNGKKVVIRTAEVSPREFVMDWKENMLNRIADPQIVFILFIIAIAGIGMEFKNPGMIVPGAIGAVSLFMFLMAVRIIPINIVGLILIILAIVLFILELSITSYGLLTLGGIISFVIGSMILIDSPLPGGQIPLSTIAGAVLFLLGFIFLVVRSVLRAHQNRITTGKDGLVGETALVLRDFSGKGKVLIRGEIWNARSDAPLEKDDEVEVLSVKGMDLEVKKRVYQ